MKGTEINFDLELGAVDQGIFTNELREEEREESHRREITASTGVSDMSEEEMEKVVRSNEILVELLLKEANEKNRKVN